MKTNLIVVVLLGFGLTGLAQTNTDIAPVATPASTNVTLQTSNLPSLTKPVPESTAVKSRDIRDVSGVKVNLGPIHDYEANPSGERPLKHWKKITFLTVGPAVAGQSTCQIKIEGGGEITAVVKNVPQKIIDAYAAPAKLADQQKEITQQVEVEAKRALAEATRAVADAGTGGDPQKLAAADPNLQARTAQLSKLERDIKDAQSYFASVATDYAMFTGKKAGQMEIWDCGIKYK